VSSTSGTKKSCSVFFSTKTKWWVTEIHVYLLMLNTFYPNNVLLKWWRRTQSRRDATEKLKDIKLHRMHVNVLHLLIGVTRFTGIDTVIFKKRTIAITLIIHIWWCVNKHSINKVIWLIALLTFFKISIEIAIQSLLWISFPMRIVDWTSVIVTYISVKQRISVFILNL